MIRKVGLRPNLTPKFLIFILFASNMQPNRMSLGCSLKPMYEFWQVCLCDVRKLGNEFYRDNLLTCSHSIKPMNIWATLNMPWQQKLINAICWVKINGGASLFSANRHVFSTDAISTPATAPCIQQYFYSGLIPKCCEPKGTTLKKEELSMLCTRSQNPIRNSIPKMTPERPSYQQVKDWRK